MKLSKKDRKLIEEAVALAEKTTSGEIVPVIMKKSDHYPAAHFRLAILIALITPFIYFFIPFETLDYILPSVFSKYLVFLSELDPIWLIYIQLPALFIGYSLGFIPYLKYLFTTKGEIKEEVHQKAVEVFFKQSLHTTRDRTGILIFISLLEKRVEILCDAGINQKVEEGTWDNILKKITLEMKKGQIVTGISQGIKDCGEILTKFFPIKDDDTNELKNELISDCDE